MSLMLFECWTTVKCVCVCVCVCLNVVLKAIISPTLFFFFSLVVGVLSATTSSFWREIISCVNVMHKSFFRLPPNWGMDDVIHIHDRKSASSYPVSLARDEPLLIALRTPMIMNATIIIIREADTLQLFSYSPNETNNIRYVGWMRATNTYTIHIHIYLYIVVSNNYIFVCIHCPFWSLFE